MNRAEEEFQKYLNKHDIPFWFIDQETNTFSKSIKKLNTKRPDFFVFIPKFGFILVDIKDKVPLKKHKKICLDYQETVKYFNLHQYFNMQVWYVISNKNVHYSTWFCIPASKAIEFDDFLIDNRYLSIPLEEYVQLSTNESFFKLLSQNQTLV